MPVLASILAMTILPLAKVRDQLSSLVDNVTRTHDTLTITRNGTPAAVMISIDDYESIMETLELLNDPIDRQRLDEAERSIATGDITGRDEIDRLVAERAQRAGRAP
jgi:antitoxin YefM